MDISNTKSKLINLYLGVMKFNHWTIFLLTLFLGITGIIGCTALSIPELMEKMDFAFAVAEIDGGPASKRMIVRVLRGQMWELHYVAGVIMYILFFFGYFVSAYRASLKKNPFVFLFLIVLTILFITGLIRHYRGELEFTRESDRFIRDGSKTIHHYASWSFLILLIGHTIHIIYSDLTKYKNIISHSFKCKKFMFHTLLALLVIPGVMQPPLFAAQPTDTSVLVITKYIKDYESDKNFKEAMEYYSGKKGFIMVEKEFPACPYDACKSNNDKVEQVEKEDGSRLYKIKIHDWISAKKEFDQSIEKYKNPISAEYNLFMLLERINYKDKVYDAYLLADMKKSLNIDTPEEYKKEVAKLSRELNNSKKKIEEFNKSNKNSD